MIRVRLRHVVPAGDCVRHGLARLADCYKLHAVGFLQRWQVGDLGDSATADEGYSYRFGHRRGLKCSAACEDIFGACHQPLSPQHRSDRVGRGDRDRCVLGLRLQLQQPAQCRSQVRARAASPP